MRILIVTAYRSFRGGVESVTRMLQAVFEEDGHEVSYLTADGPFPWQAQLLRRLVGLPAVTALRFRQIRRNSFDLIIANGEFGWGIRHPRALCLFHGSYAGFRDHVKPHLSARQIVSLSWLSRIQKQAAVGKRVVAVSQFVADILEAQGIAVEGVIANCVDTDRFRPPPAKKRKGYLFVGNYHRYGKGFDILEEVARNGIVIDCVTDTDPGSGLGFLGPRRPEEMPEVYRSYGFLVFPSRFEGLGLAPLEAMSCGLPLVMTDVGLGPELARELPQFVVGLGSSKLALLIVDRIALIEASYDQYSRAARDYVLRNHSVQRFKDEWRKCVERMTG